MIKIEFQSTSSVWRTTKFARAVLHAKWISIHVLRVEDDDDKMLDFENLEISIHVLRVEDDPVFSAHSA